MPSELAIAALQSGWTSANQAFQESVSWLLAKYSAEYVAFAGLRDTIRGPKLDIRYQASPSKVAANRFASLIDTQTGVRALRNLSPETAPCGAAYHQAIAPVVRAGRRSFGVLIVVTSKPLDDTLLHLLNRLAQTIADFVASQGTDVPMSYWDEDSAIRKARALRQAERLEATGSFAAGIAHEINSPLSTILLNAQLLEREQLSEKAMSRVGTIVENSRRCTEIIQSLLVLASGDVPPMERFDFDTLVTDSVGFLRSTFPEAVVNFEPGAPDAFVKANRTLIQQVLSNLTSNAAKATNGSPEIWIHTWRTPSLALLRFCDNGPGIPAGLEERVFDPFFT
ncbi:MAG: HAMP domain-containing histidine kinase, partial [Myxococcales bacterium]|nr:HAMP domain-containing histidine kinase [Myxococcales bacterium]